MAVTLNGQSIDPRVIMAWKAALKAADEVDLQVFARNHKQLNAGFRKGKVSLPVLLTRILAMLDQSKDLSTDLCKLLRDATLSRKLICVLSEEAITFSLNPLADAYGRLKIYAALQLDERESIRKIGFEKISSWNGIEANDSEQKQAVKDLRELLPGFLNSIQVLLFESSLSETNPSGERKDITHKRDKKTEKLITDFRATRTALNRLRRDFNDVSIAKDRINAISDASSVDLKRTTQTLNLASQNYTELQENFEQRVKDAVRIELDQKLVPWLKQAEVLERIVLEMPVDLLQDAEDLLRRQVETDKKFGLRSQLAAEATKCQALQLRLKEALAESIRPLPELGVVIQRLENRIAEIERILQQNAISQTDARSAPSLFIEKLNATSTLDELADIRKGLVFLETTGLMADSELGGAYTLIADKASRFYLQSVVGTASRSQPAALDGVPLYALQRKITDGHNCVLLIDGHNVLHKLPSLFGEAFEGGIPGAKAQKALILMIATFCDVNTNLIVKLWFDSPRAHDETISSNFTVHYSGGKGTNRADDQIVSYLQFLSTQSPHIFRALVTDDRDEAAKSAACGAHIVSPIEFEMFLRR